jgi:hypothetical protein
LALLALQQSPRTPHSNQVESGKSRIAGALSRLRRKLHAGNIMKFVSEITHEDVED